MKKLIVLIILSIWLISCKNSNHVTITSGSTPANVFVNGKLVGKTPLNINLQKGKNNLQVSFDSILLDSTNVNNSMTKLVTSYLPIAANLPLFVAMEKGYFKMNGIDLEAIESASPNDIITGLVAGKVDFAPALAYTILFPAVIQYPGKFRFYSSTEETIDHFTSSIIVKKSSPIKTIAQLKGKRIGIYSGLVQKIFLKSILIGMGIDPNQVTIVEISPRLQIQGLVSDQYDALSSTEPTTNVAIAMGIARPLIENPRVKYIQCPFPSTAATLSESLIKNKPDVARGVIRSLDMAIDYINSNPAEAKKILPKYTPVPEEKREQILADLKLFRYCKLGNENRLNVQRFADFLYKEGLIKQKIQDVNVLFGDFENAGSN